MKTTDLIRTKGAEAARQQLPSVLAAAALGTTTLITRHGREIAAVVPVAAVKSKTTISLLSLAGSGRGLWGSDVGAEIIRLRDEWNR